METEEKILESDSSADQLDADHLDAVRRSRERKILIAVIALPVVMGLFHTGQRHVLIDWLRSASEYYLTWGLFERFLLTTLVGATSLLVWRYPLFAKPYVSPVFVMLGALSVLFYCSEQKSFDGIVFWLACYGPVLIIFLLLRVWARFCITAVDENDLPQRGRLSILHLIYWTAGCAAFFAAAKFVAQSVTHRSLLTGMTPSLIPWLFIPEIFAITSTMLVAIFTRRYRWWVCLVAVTLVVISRNYAVAWCWSWYMSSPFFAPWTFLLMLSVTEALGAISGLWLSQLGGYRIKRFPKWTSPTLT